MLEQERREKRTAVATFFFEGILTGLMAMGLFWMAMHV
jgi:hypothetical protein